MHGDNRHTLTASCHEEVEAEANYGAGRLLFLRDRFSAEALDLPISINSVQSLHKGFGNTISSTLWRFVETAGVQRPMIGMISCHPHRSRRPANFDPAQPCRHFIQSTAFASRFSRISEADLFNAVSQFCGAQQGGPLGTAELVLMDDNGEEHIFQFECFFIKYRGPAAGETLTLGSYVRPHTKLVA